VAVGLVILANGCSSAEQTAPPATSQEQNNAERDARRKAYGASGIAGKTAGPTNPEADARRKAGGGRR